MEPQTAPSAETFDMRARPCPTCGTEARRTPGTQINKLALLGMSNNLSAWARRE